jgi:hypothetical protein
MRSHRILGDAERGRCLRQAGSVSDGDQHARFGWRQAEDGADVGAGQGEAAFRIADEDEHRLLGSGHGREPAEARLPKGRDEQDVGPELRGSRQTNRRHAGARARGLRQMGAELLVLARAGRGHAAFGKAEPVALGGELPSRTIGVQDGPVLGREQHADRERIERLDRERLRKIHRRKL